MATLACVLSPGPASAATTPTGLLNDTGSQLCYDNDLPQACEPAGFPGQDARAGRDAAATDGVLVKTGGGDHAFDFTKVSNSGDDLPANAAAGTAPGDWACTRDNVTGLLWQRRFPDVNNRFTWSQAFDYAASLNTGAGTCGRTDWRLPRNVELQSIIDYGTPITPIYDKTYFAPMFGGFDLPYWSSEPSVYVPEIFPDYAWYLSVGPGNLSIAPKTDLHVVRAVAGTPVASTRVNQPDGTVLDTATGLEFDRCALGQVLSGDVCIGTPSTYVWQGALNAAQASNDEFHLGHADWRLPNMKELTILVDYGRYDQASDFRYWTSTPYQELESRAEVVNLGIGYAYDSEKSDPARVRLVRGGIGLSAYRPPDPNVVFRSGFE